MTRAQWILLGLLVVQGLLLLWIQAPFSGEAAGVGARPLLPVLASVTPARIQIDSGDGDSVTLERGASGWTVTTAAGYPADGEEITGTLRTLKGLTVRRSVVSSPRYHATLKVTEDAFERRVRMWREGTDDPDVDLLVGTSSNYQLSHARLAAEDRVYEVSGLSVYDLFADASGWVKSEFVEVPFAEVTGVAVTNPQGTFTLEKQDGLWTSPGQTLDPTKVETFVRAVSTVRLQEPVGAVDPAAHGLQPPAATVTIRHAPAGGAGQTAPAAPAQTTTLQIGAEVPEGNGQRYAGQAGFGFTVTLSRFDAERVLDQKLADLLPE